MNHMSRIVVLTGLLMAWTSLATGAESGPPVQYGFRTVGGVKIFFREAGDRDKPTILLLHGFPTSSHMFRDLIPLLSGRFHVIAFDYPGMGYSEAPAADVPASFDSLAVAAENFIEATHQKHLILYMQDFGGPVGMRLAVKHPDWIAGLIFQNTPISLDGWNADRLRAVQAGAGPVTPEKRAAAEHRVSLETAIFLYKQGARSPQTLNPDAWANDAFALANPDSRRVMTDLILDIPSNLDLYPVWREYLASHRPKTLVVWGKNDPVFASAGAEAIRSAVGEAEVDYYDTGHFALEEAGDDIAKRIIRRFAK